MIGRVRTVLWHGDEGRPSAPVRLAVATLAFVVVGEAVRRIAATVAGLAGPLGPALRAVWVVVVAVAGFATAICVVLAVAVAVDRRRPSDFGLGLDRAWAREALRGGLVGVAMAGGIAVVSVGLGLATVRGPVRSWVGTLSLTSEHAVFDAAFWAVVFLGAGLLEEVLVRGYLLVNVAEGLARSVTDPTRAVLAAVALSAVAFGLLHGANPGTSALAVANVVLFGLVLGATVAATGRLALAVGVHVAWNVTLGLGFGLPVSGIETGAALVDVDLRGSSLLTGGTFGPEGGALALVGLTVGVACLGWLLRRDGGLSVDPRIAEPDLWRSDEADA